MRRLVVALLALSACDDRSFEEPVTLGGVVVDAATLNLGQSAYRNYCAPCHGDDGDGSGALGARQKPAPRDLRLGVIKYASVPAGAVPRDEDVLRVLRHGLRGTPMLGLPLPESDLTAIVHYTKTLSPRRRDEAPPPAVPIPADPWPQPADAVARGRALYHGAARCVACHPAHLSAARAEVAARSFGVTRERLETAVATPSAYGELVAPDLARATIRSGTGVIDLYRVIAAGVGGTEMKSLAGVLPEKELWALAHYSAHVVAFGGDRR